MTASNASSVALLYPGDRTMRDRADPAESRFAALFTAFARAGVSAEPAVWHDDFAGEVARQLRRMKLVLVWCNPIEGARRRDRLDALLREVAASGVIVSADPDAVQCLGTKDVLVATRDLPFGSDVCRIDSLEQLATELPARLTRGARVLKQHRGHSGIGVWLVERLERSDTAARPALLRVRHAQRGSEEEVLTMAQLLERLGPYFELAQGGHMVDQAWQPRLAEGMVRAYLVEDRVTGFGHQTVNALLPSLPGRPAPQPGPRLYHRPDEPTFQPLKQQLEAGWIEQLRERVGLARDRLPLLWDCDFMHGESAPGEPARHVLCEINVSSVSPFPPSSIAPLVAAVRDRLAACGR
jgi:hypothetical protein